MKSKFFPIAFVLLLAILTYGLIWNGCNSAQAQGRGDKAPATQFTRDSTITLILFHPTLRDTLVFQSATGNAPLADSAITLRLQKLTTGHFLATSADSLYKILIDSSDWARYIRDGGITKRSAFSPTAFDSLQGSPTNNYADNWVIYATHSRGADTANYSNYAFLAGTAQAAQTYIGTDPVPEALHSLTSDYATTALNAISQQGYFTVQQWDSIYDSVTVWISIVDTPAVATKALTVATGAVDSLSNFSTVVKDSYLVTKNIRDALNETITNGAAKSLTNPVVDSIGMYQTMVVNQNPTRPISIGFRDVSGTMSANNVLFDTTHATNKKGSIRWVDAQANDTTIFNDSLTISAMINSTSDLDSADYILRGTGGSPSRLTVTNATPTGGSNGDLWINTQDSSFSVKISGAWDPISGGGGGGGPATSLSTGTFGTIDADCVAFKSEDMAITGEYAFYGGVAVMNNTDFVVTGEALFDSISAVSGGFIRVSENDTIGGLYVIGTPNVSKQPNAYVRNFTVSGTASLGALLDAGTLDPNSSNRTLGVDNTSTGQFDATYTRQLFMGYNATQGYPYSVITNGSSESIVTQMQAAGSGITFINTDVVLDAADLSVASGSISSPSINVTSGPQLTGPGIDLTSGDYINVPSTATIRVQSGGEILVKDDSVGFADLDNTAIKYHLVEDSIWQAGITACPDPTPTNPLLTENWHTGWWKKVMRDADSLYERRLNPRDNFWYKAVGCDDSTYFGGENNNSIAWPVIDGVPIELPGNQHLIGPWVPIVLPPANPIVIDSGANIYRYNDPNPGYPEHIIQVSERFDGRWGFLTGKFQTIKQACDSLPNFRVRLDSCVTSTNAGGTFRITPLSPHTGNNLRIYRGETLVASSIRDTLPDFLKKQGTFVKFRLTGQEAGRWCEIESWPTDTTFTIVDSVIGGYFTSVSTPDSVWDLTFAIKTTIEVLPPVSGGHVIIDSTIVIHDECPVRIKGTDKNEVILTNFRGTSTLCQPMFQVKSTANYDTCYVGMPIEFADMTIYADTLGATNNEAVIEVAGNARFENINLVSTIFGQSKGVVRHNYFKNQYVLGSTPFLIFENVTCVLNSDGVVAGLVGDSTDFQSYNSVYAVSGDSGCVLLLHENNWPTASTHNPPTFFGDQFYFGTSGARLAGTWTAQAWDSVSVVQSHFIGIDGVSSDGSGVLKGDLNNIIPNGNNSYNSLYDKPPTKLKALPIKAPYIPKK